MTEELVSSSVWDIQEGNTSWKVKPEHKVVVAAEERKLVEGHKLEPDHKLAEGHKHKVAEVEEGREQ